MISTRNAIAFFLTWIMITACSIRSGHIDTDKNSSEKIASAEFNFPPARGYVNDFANVLEKDEEDNLEQKLNNYDKQTTNQIAIVSIDSEELNKDNFDQYSLELSNHWGVGTKEKNNGLTIVFSPSLRKVRINTGLSTEKMITDQTCSQIIENIIIPHFKSGDYFNGLNDAVDELMKYWK